MSVTFIALGGYALLLSFIGWYLSRGESEEGYLIANRNRPWWQILFSKFAATIGVAWFVSYTAFAYEYGWSMVTLIVGVMFGYLIYAYWGAPRILRFSNESGGFYGMGDLVKARTGSVHAERFINVYATVAAFLWVVIPVVGAGVLMDEFGLLAYEQAIVLTVVVVSLYVLASGFKAVIVTDVIQGLIVFFLLGAAVYVMYAASAAGDGALLAVRAIDPVLVFMFLFLGAAVTFASTDRYQLSYAAANEQAIKRGMATAFIPVAFAAITLLILGNLVFSVSADIDPDAAFAEAMRLFLDPVWFPMILIMFAAGLMSSIDSAVYAAATHSVQLFSARKISRATIQQAVIALAVLALVLAFVFRSITDLAIFTSSLAVGVAFAMIYLIAGRTNHLRFLSLVYCGVGATLIGVFVVGVTPMLAMFPLLGNILGAVLPVSWFSRFGNKHQ